MFLNSPSSWKSLLVTRCLTAVNLAWASWGGRSRGRLPSMAVASCVHSSVGSTCSSCSYTGLMLVSRVIWRQSSELVTNNEMMGKRQFIHKGNNTGVIGK